MKTVLKTIEREGSEPYLCLMFVCPGCAEFGSSGIHMLPVTEGKYVKPRAWIWNGDHYRPTLTPSIRTTQGEHVCHAYLRAGLFEYLDDSTHSLSGKTVPLPDIPDFLLDGRSDADQ